MSNMSSLNKHPVHYFELFQRLLGYQERGGYSDMHWDKLVSSTFTAAVVDEIASRVAEEFLDLFCNV